MRAGLADREIVDSRAARWKTGERKGRVNDAVDREADDVTDAPSVRKWPYDFMAAISFGLGLLVPVVIAGWTLDEGLWFLALIAGAVAVAVYWRATVIYRKWAIDGTTATGARLGVCAGIGISMCVGGSFVLDQASDQDSRLLAAIGIALVVVGLMPIMHAIRYEPEPHVGRPWEVIAFGWVLNTLFAFAALTPGLLILGAPVLVAVLLPAAWLASVAVNRLSRFRSYRVFAVPVLGGLAVVSGLCFLGVNDPGDQVLLVIGLLVTCLGCIDAVSAPVRRQQRVPWSATRVKVAVALVATAIVAAVFVRVTVLENVPALVAVVVLLVCFGFGGSYVRRGQGLAVLAVLGALTLWVIADRDDPARRDPAPDASGTVVALGDSYASGEGADAFFAGTNVQQGNQCRRTSGAYGYQVARTFDRHLEFFACSGALANQVWDQPQVTAGSAGDAIGTRPQLDNPVRSTPDLVLISIGGNDALFGSVGRGCALPGSCVDIKHVFDGNLADVRKKVATALTKVSERFPRRPILVVPYPQMLPTPPEREEDRHLGDCEGVPLGGAELDYLHGFVARLDEQVERAVTLANEARGSDANIAYFAEGEEAYLGHRVCGPGNGDSAVNTLALGPTEATNVFDRLIPTSWNHNSFHPKALGHDLLMRALEPWIRENVPGFGDATEFPVTREARTKPVPETDGTCESRKVCTDEVNAWSTGKTIEAIRSVFPYAVLLGFLGWLLAAVRRLRVHVPPRESTESAAAGT